MGKDADGVHALFVTVDPERDTAGGDEGLSVELRSAFARRHRHAHSRSTAVEKEYRVIARKVPIGDKGDYSMDHSALVYLMDKQGRFVAPFNLKRKPAEAAAALRKYL